MTSGPIRVNRAPVLTLWAAIVAERLGHPPATALSLAGAVAGTAARAKARRLGLAGQPGSHHGPQPSSPRRQVELLGRAIPVVGHDGQLRAAEPDGSPAAADPVGAYVARAFGSRLPEVREAMEGLAARLPAEELNRIGFRLYEVFRPEVPEGVEGWGARARLDLARIRGALDPPP